MLVQAFYGYVTNSLGLLSDTVHMFFDCVALLVGLVAAVASKWPRSQRFPYGLGKMESLSGFANGILLMWVLPFFIPQAFWKKAPSQAFLRKFRDRFSSTTGCMSSSKSL